MSEVSQERLCKDARRILEHPFYIPELETGLNYERLHDDHDGTFQGSLVVTIAQDDDIWVDIDRKHERDSLRFRNYFGGGMSLRVRNALMILALAIKLDNEECPQHIPNDSSK